MAKKKVIVSRSGLTTCPSCMSHITLNPELVHTECPFCEANLVAERRQDGGTFGRNTLQTLRKSRSAMLAAALGASLSMAACGEGENNDNNTTTNNTTDNNTPQPAYGAPLTDQGNGADDMEVDEKDMDVAVPEYGAPAADMSGPSPLYGAPPADMEVDEKDMDFAVPEYGAPPEDM